MSRFSVALALFFLLSLFPLHSPAAASDDEFVGPFVNWGNLKRDYNAVGDGRADDTAALQKALNELAVNSHSSILYLPAGTYHITQGLTMTSQMNVAVLGEHVSPCQSRAARQPPIRSR